MELAQDGSAAGGAVWLWNGDPCPFPGRGRRGAAWQPGSCRLQFLLVTRQRTRRRRWPLAPTLLIVSAWALPYCFSNYFFFLNAPQTSGEAVRPLFKGGYFTQSVLGKCSVGDWLELERGKLDKLRHGCVQLQVSATCRRLQGKEGRYLWTFGVVTGPSSYERPGT